jgi:hypothetical protein
MATDSRLLDFGKLFRRRSTAIRFNRRTASEGSASGSKAYRPRASRQKAWLAGQVEVDSSDGPPAAATASTTDDGPDGVAAENPLL